MKPRLSRGTAEKVKCQSRASIRTLELENETLKLFLILTERNMKHAN
ncbi:MULTISPECIES: hypothetical protein [unclassified Fusibacter]|nr:MULTISPECIES: hypothetical protein [unclassified Fusibacter]MCK8060259.1 hypothetical protein [Fusibacter sp. A2]NPE20453.1 hypothetical protein [Fusibacter sp. A1]